MITSKNFNPGTMYHLSFSSNTVHRDLAARNILVQKHQDDSMVAKVADFGLSRSVIESSAAVIRVQL